MATYKFDSYSSYLDFTDESGIDGVSIDTNLFVNLYYVNLTDEQVELFEDLLTQCGAWEV